MMKNIRLALSIFWIILGGTLLGLSIAEIIDSTLYSGMGGALIAVGMLQVIKQIKYRTNKHYKEETDIAISDERNKYLRLKAMAIAAYSVVLIQACGSVFAYILGYSTIGQFLLFSVSLIVFIYWLAYVILNKIS